MMQDGMILINTMTNFKNLDYPCEDFVEDIKTGYCALMHPNGSCKRQNHFICALWILAVEELNKENYHESCAS